VRPPHEPHFGPPCLTLCHAPSPVNDDNALFPAGAETVTFVGRPFPLDEAPQHLARLRRWGLTFSELSFLACLFLLTSADQVRFLITWEAVEHEGPYVLRLSSFHCPPDW